MSETEMTVPDTNNRWMYYKLLKKIMSMMLHKGIKQLQWMSIEKFLSHLSHVDYSWYKKEAKKNLKIIECENKEKQERKLYEERGKGRRRRRNRNNN